jgi:hypothetical protein
MRVLSLKIPMLQTNVVAEKASIFSFVVAQTT